MGETKKCKHCQSEIDKKAKICPNCRKKQGGTLKFVIAGIVIIGIIGAIGSQKDEPKKVQKASTESQDTSNKAKTENDAINESEADENEEETVKEEETTTFKTGETASLKDVLVTLDGVSESTGGQFNKPTDGNIFLLCEFTIENDSEKDIAVSSIMSFEAYCDDFSVTQSFGGLMEKGNKNQLDGSVAAGKKMNGVIAYEVPTDWKEIEINFTPDFWGKEITFIATK